MAEEHKAIDSLSSENRTFAPPAELTAEAHVKSLDEYQVLYDRSVNDSDAFWLEQADAMVAWSRKPTRARQYTWNTAERKIEQKIQFSDTAGKEAREMIDEIYTMCDGIVAALDKNEPPLAEQALKSENKLNRMQVDLRRHHVKRMTEGLCSAKAGLIFIDLVDNIEKMGDHLTNIGQSIIGGLQWDGLDDNMLSGEFKAITSD